MIYTELTKKAMKIAFDAHKNQVDKAGLPYIFHPFHLAEQMETEDEVCVALLHDVVEDSDITLDELRSYSFPEQVMEALSILTRDESSTYSLYILTINYSENPLVKKVKLADLRHNSDKTRLDEIGEKEQERFKKYSKAIGVLSGTDDYWTYYFDDISGAIIRMNCLDKTQMMKPKTTEWRVLQPDNSYMREIYLGQGNNCLTKTTEEEAFEVIEQWRNRAN